MDADDQVLLAVVGAEELYVLRGETGIEEALLHGCRAGGDVAERGVGSVDLDELLEDGDGFFTVFGRSGCYGLRTCNEREAGDGKACDGGSGDRHGGIVRCRAKRAGRFNRWPRSKCLYFIEKYKRSGLR